MPMSARRGRGVVSFTLEQLHLTELLAATRVRTVRVFDLSFDYQTDYDPAKPKKPRWDADEHSPRLRLDHELLWTKRFRSGVLFAPTAPRARSRGYLIWTEPSGEQHWYGSDAITHSYTTWQLPKALADAKAGLSEEERAAYLAPPYTIGSSIIWPVKSSARPSMNQARCFGPARRTIADRIDLTLECIRRHYLGLPSDDYLGQAIRAYAEFFDLFQGFAEFVEFFHLQPLVAPEGVRSLFNMSELLGDYGFEGAATPSTTEEYVAYRRNTLAVIAERGRLMADWVAGHHPEVEVRR
jgi:hypothetical protein